MEKENAKTPEIVSVDRGQIRRWMPDQVVFTPAALAEPWGRQIAKRVADLKLPITELHTNRLTGLRGSDERATYRTAKRTLAVVTAPAGMLKLQPIPPSADWQFHLATGCPAHCQYCYLAGSLQGPPVVRVFANLPSILDATRAYIRPDGETSFEASCYTDPLALEHLTGSLSECINYFGKQQRARLRWVSKFDAVEPLLDLAHNGHTRCRISVNAETISQRLEGGTSSLDARLAALRRLALPRSAGGGGYPVGLVIAPIMPILGWQSHYGDLLSRAASALDFPCDLTVELITHRFTPTSKTVLRGWYPNSALEMDEACRSVKRGKHGATKFVYPMPVMRELRLFFERELGRRLPQARTLYWT